MDEDDEKDINSVLNTHLGRFDLHLDDEELTQINDSVINKYIDDQNWGILLSRLKHNDREKAFAEEWFEANKIKRWINGGCGLLQDLFIDQDKNSNRRFIHRITHNDREIAATVVQWFGSNIGMSFLERALDRCGYKLIKK